MNTITVSRDGKEYSFVLLKGKTVVGKCKLYLLSTKNNPNRGLLSEFFIYKRFRGQGYGSELLTEVIKFGRNILLWVKDTNVAAKNLYAKHGFNKIGTEGPGVDMMFRKVEA